MLFAELLNLIDDYFGVSTGQPSASRKANVVRKVIEEGRLHIEHDGEVYELR